MATTRYIYDIPFEASGRLQAISDPRMHGREYRNAIDFPLPVGTIIRAPRAGTVVALKVNSRRGGPDEKYAGSRYANYLIIKHSDWEFSQYAHLQHKSALVKVGDRVRRGQPIAMSGNTGFSTGPHLHFHVLRFRRGEPGVEILRVRFVRKVSIIRCAQ